MPLSHFPQSVATLASSVLLIAGCGRPAPGRAREAPGTKPSAIIGANDLVLVEPPFESLEGPVRNAALAIGRLSSPCTVTHLGEGRAITAAHCVPDLESPDCSSLTVLWDDPATAREEIPCRRVAFFEFASGVDVAVLEFAVYPKAKVAPSSAFRTGSALAGRALTILSHPGGGPLMSSGTCARITVRDTIPSEQFTHDCDTRAGSSGAAVLDAATGELVGIHSAGVSGSGGRYNLATRVGAVDFLR